MRWRLYLEEYGATFKYIEGKNKDLADALSRLPSKECNEKVIGKKKTKENSKNDQFYSLTDDKELLDCFPNLPQEINKKNPIQLSSIQQEHFTDDELNHAQNYVPHKYTIICLHVLDLVGRIDDNDPSSTRICIPTSLLKGTINWFHKIFGHVGKTNLYNTMSQQFYHSKLKANTDAFDCAICQRNKLLGRPYVHLPSR